MPFQRGKEGSARGLAYCMVKRRTTNFFKGTYNSGKFCRFSPRWVGRFFLMRVLIAGLPGLGKIS
jgi:hypothetical protein